MEHERLTLQAIREIDELCDHFEDAWKSNAPVEIDSIMSSYKGSERLTLLRELVATDIYYRWRNGETVDAASYEAQLGPDAAIFDEVIESLDRQALSTAHGPLSSVEQQRRASGSHDAFPAQLGRYQIVDRVGKGAFGVVYRATDVDLKRTVAIKCPRQPKLRSNQRWESFRREAELAAKITHPHVVGIYDLGRDANGQPFIVMEYVAGQSLKERLRAGPLRHDLAVTIATVLVESLRHVHGQGLVHRDLKPANVILDQADMPHIADLGLALDLQEDQVMGLAGTVAYMAPEQLQPDPASLDHRCDIWAVGTMLYEMLTGQRPFGASQSEPLRAQILNDVPPNVRELDQRIPVWLSRICKKCLEKDPALRYQSAAELLAELRQEGRSTVGYGAAATAVVAALSLMAVVYGVSKIPSATVSKRGTVTTGSTPVTASETDHPASHDSSTLGHVQPLEVPDSEDDVQDRPWIVADARFGSLQDAVAAAAEQDARVIIVDSDDVVPVEPIDLEGLSIEISAADGRRPILELAGSNHVRMMMGHGNVTLRGLTIRRGGFTGDRVVRADTPCLVQVATRGKVTGIRCLFQCSTGQRSSCIVARGASCEFQDCEFVNPDGSAVNWTPGANNSCEFDNCYLDAKLAVMQAVMANNSELRATNCTVSSGELMVVMGLQNVSITDPIRLAIVNCLIDVDTVLHCVIPRLRPSDGDATGTARERLRWAGDHNVFHAPLAFLQCNFGGASTDGNVKDIASWDAFWSMESRSVRVEPVPRSLFDDETLDQRNKLRAGIESIHGIDVGADPTKMLSR
ncbi:MAG: serine/threonine-protein kinase [Pirellulaceae bacterium]